MCLTCSYISATETSTVDHTLLISCWFYCEWLNALTSHSLDASTLHMQKGTVLGQTTDPTGNPKGFWPPCDAEPHATIIWHTNTLWPGEVLELQQHNLYIKYAYAESQILFQLVTIFCVHVLLLKAGHMAEILHCCSSHWPRQSQIIKSGQTLFSQRKGLNFIWPPIFSLHLRF